MSELGRYKVRVGTLPDDGYTEYDPDLGRHIKGELVVRMASGAFHPVYLTKEHGGSFVYNALIYGARKECTSGPPALGFANQGTFVKAEVNDLVVPVLVAEAA